MLGNHSGLDTALRKLDINLPLNTSASELKWLCQALYWEHRADQFAAACGMAEQRAQEQEKYTQELFAENEKLRADYDHLQAAFKLQTAYAASEVPPSLAEPIDKPE